MKAFISYSTIDKKYGANIKASLDELGINVFLAHEDLSVSDEWQREIMAHLKACNVFIPLLSKAFKESNWCALETGIVAVKKSVLIVPISLDGTIPFGFISHIQSHSLEKQNIEKQVLLDAIGKKWPSEVVKFLLPHMENAHSYRGAEALVAPLVPYFRYFSAEQANVFADYAIKNGQIWSASLCAQVYLPEFLKITKDRLKQNKYRVLKYQVENQRGYEPRKVKSLKT